MLSPATRISLCTVRLLCSNHAGSTSQGTGFLYAFRETPDAPVMYPTIITNKHVVGNFPRLSTVVTEVPDVRAVTEASLGLHQTHHAVTIDNLQNWVVPHPDPNTDLCAILVGPFINGFLDRPGFRHMVLDETWLPDQSLREYLRVVEPILMVGYPNGIWDESHNLPVVRDGKTSSHALLKWNNTSSFVVDTAVFGGSSGSPIFLYEDGMYRSNATSYTPGSRTCLLGILWGGPVVSVRGELQPESIPTGAGEVPVIRSMMNLGFAVRGDALIEMTPHVLARGR